MRALRGGPSGLSVYRATVWAVGRFPPDYFQANDPLVLTTPYAFDKSSAQDILHKVSQNSCKIQVYTKGETGV
jgi:hypothetical protein